MALARVKTWTAGEVLFAADLNGEINNVLNNALALISPLTGNLNFNNNQAVSMKLEVLGASPAAGQGGRIVFQTSQNQPEVDDGVAMRRVPAIISTSLATGDLIAASTASTWIRVAVGSSGQALVASSSSSVPIYRGVPAQAYVVFSGVTTSSGITPLQAFGVSTAANTIIKNSSGDYTIPWQTAFASTNYVLSMAASVTTGGFTFINTVSSGNSTGSATVRTRSVGNIEDPPYISVIAYGTV